MATQTKVVMTDNVVSAVKALVDSSEPIFVSSSGSEDQSQNFNLVKKTIDSLKNKIEALKVTLNELEKSLTLLSENLR